MKLPNGYVIFLDNGISDFHTRLELVKKTILEYNEGQWPAYFYEGWLRESSMAGRVFNQTREILDRIGTYLMIGNFDNANVLTRRMTKKIYNKELPVSNTSSSVSNLLYGDVDSEDEVDTTVSVSSVLTADEPKKDIYDMSDEDIAREKKKARKSKKKWKSTSTYKMNRLYSTPSIQTYRVKPVKGPNGGSLKDISGNVVLQAIELTIGGHKGLLESATKFSNVPSYVAKWCIVDVDGKFSFMGKNYMVNDKRYEVNNTAKIGPNGELNEFTNQAGMEKIMCVYLPDQGLLFYDEQINHVDASTIGEL